MTPLSSPQPQRPQRDPDQAVRVGAWLFERRTWLPVPLAVALLLTPSPEGLPSPFLRWAGIGLVSLGEVIRLWAVRHIGVISRTRSDRLGPLVSTGPFARVRNPLYLGNIALWVGFALSAHLAWMAIPIVVVLGVEYHAIVRWEERLLEARRGEAYREYAARVPRWLPNLHRISASSESSVVASFSWRETFFSERGTLVAIAAGYLLLWLKLEGLP